MIRPMISMLLLGVSATVPSVAPAQPAEVRITIQRQTEGSSCITGTILVNDRHVAHTLERPNINNTPQISAVPAGTYQATVRFDHADAWRLELQDVPGRQNVQIHVGNWVNQTRGCILIGASVDASTCTISDSRAAYRQFQRAIYGDAAGPAFPERRITVRIANTRP